MAVAVDITFHPSWWYANAGVRFNEDFFCSPQYRMEADIKMRKSLYERFGDAGLGEKDPGPRPIMGSDLIASGYLFSQIMGCEVRFSEGNPPEVLCANLPDDRALSLKMPELAENRYWKNTLDQFEYLESRYGYVESHINLQGVQNIAMDLRGSELFIDYYEKPKIAENLIRECSELMLEAGREIRKRSKVMSHGVTAITRKVMPDVYLTSNCSVEMISQGNYEDFLLQADRRLAEEFKPFGIHHCGKTMEHVAEGYKKVKDLAFAEVGAGSDVLKVRQALPGVFLNLRYSPVRIKTATKEEMTQELQRMAKAAGTRFSVSCVGIDADTEDQQIKQFITCVGNL